MESNKIEIGRFTITWEDKRDAAVVAGRLRHNVPNNLICTSVADALEASLLSHFFAGVEIDEPYLDGIESALEGIKTQYKMPLSSSAHKTLIDGLAADAVSNMGDIFYDPDASDFDGEEPEDDDERWPANSAEACVRVALTELAGALSAPPSNA